MEPVFLLGGTRVSSPKRYQVSWVFKVECLNCVLTPAQSQTEIFFLHLSVLEAAAKSVAFLSASIRVFSSSPSKNEATFKRSSISKRLLTQISNVLL